MYLIEVLRIRLPAVHEPEMRRIPRVLARVNVKTIRVRLKLFEDHSHGVEHFWHFVWMNPHVHRYDAAMG